MCDFFDVCIGCKYYLPWYQSVDKVDKCCKSGTFVNITWPTFRCDDRKERD